MIAFILPLTLALSLAGAAYFLKFFFRLKPLDVLVFLAIFAELSKKLIYIYLGFLGKAASLVLSAPLILAGPWIIKELLSFTGRAKLKSVWLPFAFLMSWFGVLAIFTLVTPGASLLVLGGYATVFLWVFGILVGDEVSRRKLFLIFVISAVVGAYNIILGPDLLWRAYAQAASDISVGARYTAARGYTGSIFSSPTEYGTFALAATGILLALGRQSPGYTRLIFGLSWVAAFSTGSRYILLGVLVFWGVYALLGRVRISPLVLFVIVLAYSPVQDWIITSLLHSRAATLAAEAGNVFEQRLLTVGTLSARVGFTQALGETLVKYGLKGQGLFSYWDPFAQELPDDRHSLLLWLIIRGGIWGLALYLGFVIWHLRFFYRFYKRGVPGGRAGFAYLAAALIMSMGGPHATSGWFFLALGVFTALCLRVAGAVDRRWWYAYIEKAYRTQQVLMAGPSLDRKNS